MLRLLTEVEKNTSWIPYEKYFLTQNKVSELLSNTKSCEEPVSFTREILPVKEELPPVPDTIDVIEVTEAIENIKF